MTLLKERDPMIPFKRACKVLGLPLASAKRYLMQRQHGPKRRRPPSPRKLTGPEAVAVLDTLHSERFMDQPPRQVYAELLDQGTYLASVSTMYRLLASAGETTERRNQRVARSHAIPRLEATGPNQVWTWDITKLATYVPGKFLNLYLVLDLFSRYPVAWMVAEHENTALSKQLFAEAMTRYEIPPGSITIHNDRGAPMTSIGFTELLVELGAKRSMSRPRVSNDNAFPESFFKTTKQQPDYPGRFRDIVHARQWLQEFLDWYTNHHRHSGLAFFTPADVFFGRAEALAQTRQAALNRAFAQHPERFVSRPPKVRMPPSIVSINPIERTAGPQDSVTVMSLPGVQAPTNSAPA